MPASSPRSLRAPRFALQLGVARLWWLCLAGRSHAAPTSASKLGDGSAAALPRCQRVAAPCLTTRAAACVGLCPGCADAQAWLRPCLYKALNFYLIFFYQRDNIGNIYHSNSDFDKEGFLTISSGLISKAILIP